MNVRRMAAVLAVGAMVPLSAAALPRSSHMDGCRKSAGSIAVFQMDARDAHGAGTRDCVDGAAATGAAVWTAAGRHGGAFTFDGTKLLAVQDANFANIGTGDFTLMAWVRAIPSTHGLTVFSKDLPNNSTRRGYALILNGPFWNNVRFHDADHPENHTRVYFTANVIDSQWHHVAVSIDRDEGAVAYVDGNVVPSWIAGLPLIEQSGSLATTEPLIIGSSGLGLENPFVGSIDEVRVVGAALSRCQVRWLAGYPYDDGIASSFDPSNVLPEPVCSALTILPI